MICFSVEIVGLLLVGMASMPWMAKIGVLLAGAGFSLVFPALGVVAVKAVPAKSGRCAGDLRCLWIYRWGYRAAGRVDNDVGGRAGYLSGGSRVGGGGAIADRRLKNGLRWCHRRPRHRLNRYWITSVLMMFSAVVCAFADRQQAA